MGKYSEAQDWLSNLIKHDSKNPEALSLLSQVLLLDKKEMEDFRLYTKNNVSFSRGNMFVCRSKKIMNDYFTSVFCWLEKCEKVFGFNLEGYGKTRMYAFLAERYLSYWFNKYTKPLLWPVVFFDTSKKLNEKN